MAAQFQTTRIYGTKHDPATGDWRPLDWEPDLKEYKLEISFTQAAVDNQGVVVIRLRDSENVR